MILARPQAQLDQRARVRHRLALPAVVRLITPHGCFAGLVPRAARFPTQIVFADQRFLNRLRPFAIDFLLPARAPRFLFRRALSRGTVRLAGSLCRSRSGVVLLTRTRSCLLGCGLFFLRSVPSGILTEAGRRQRQTDHDHGTDCTESYLPGWNSTLKHLRLTFNSRGIAFSKTKSPTRRRHCHLLRSCATVPASVGLNYVTEVCLRRRSPHPVETSRAAAPGTPHPGRSSGSIQFWQDRLRFSPVPC